jgi:hypothetical protein
MPIFAPINYYISIFCTRDLWELERSSILGLHEAKMKTNRCYVFLTTFSVDLSYHILSKYVTWLPTEHLERWEWPFSYTLLNAQKVHRSSSSGYFLGWSMWALCCTKWHRSSFLNTSVFPGSHHFINSTIFHLPSGTGTGDPLETAVRRDSVWTHSKYETNISPW